MCSEMVHRAAAAWLFKSNFAVVSRFSYLDQPVDRVLKVNLLRDQQVLPRL